MNRQEFLDLAEERLREAKCLLDAGLWSGAYYLSGYAVEFCLKAIIARRFVAEDIPDPKNVQKIWTHDLERLLEIANLESEFEKRAREEERFAANWYRVRGWNEAARYRIIDEEQARRLYGALSDPNYGVIPWIRSKL